MASHLSSLELVIVIAFGLLFPLMLSLDHFRKPPTPKDPSK